MALTGDPIASITLVSATSSVTFSGIPQTYTDLVLVIHGRSSWTTDGYEAINLRFNGDSASNYSLTYLAASGASASSGRSSNSSALEFGRFNPSTSGNTNPSVAFAHIASYANSNVNKTVLGAAAASAEALPVSRYVGMWRSTAAITSVLVRPAQGAAFAAGSTADLYGLRGA
jgi:hypothetical protein